MKSTKAPKETKQPVTYTRKQIVLATAKTVTLIVIGIVIGVYATNFYHSTVDKGVADKVSQLKISQ